jgi:prepilin-type N-terminal cleavage/methylation domain-containing protein
MNKNKGFTLIELLVVIAIIGILASVVLASLNSARQKGSIAATKANMANIRAQAEIYYDGTGAGRYSAAATTTCNAASSMFADTVVIGAITQITAQAAAPACYTDSTGQKWTISTTLKDATTWCVDNSGWAKAGVANADGTCHAS